MHQVRPKTSPRSGQPTERGPNFSKAIAETQPRMATNIIQSLLEEPSIDRRFVDTARVNLRILVGTERGRVPDAVHALAWIMAECVRIVGEPQMIASLAVQRSRSGQPV